jgi:hypothetical protein
MPPPASRTAGFVAMVVLPVPTSPLASAMRTVSGLLELEHVVRALGRAQAAAVAVGGVHPGDVVDRDRLARARVDAQRARGAVLGACDDGQPAGPGNDRRGSGVRL